MRSMMTVLAAGLFAAPVCLADISYNQTSFESLAHAWTDAGDDYAYSISAADEADASGLYSFSEFGQAPGYSSSSSVGVEHDSVLTSTSMHLTGRAYTYVSDDYGYAACTADSEATTFISFTIDRRSRVTVSGTLGLTGSSAPQSFSNQFQLRNSRGQLVSSASGISTVNFDQRLPAGTYTLYVSASVSRSIDFSGGDLYENSNATFDVTLNATPVRVRGAIEAAPGIEVMDSAR